MNKKLTKQQCLDEVRMLARRIEDSDDDDASRILDEFHNGRDADLFGEIGRLTRDLHDTLNSFQLDARVAAIAEKDIPDARDRLNYVVSMTEQAARRTLNAIEETLPVSNRLGESATSLKEEWSRFTRRELTPEEFRALARRIEEFLAVITKDASHIHANLMDILMAQEYQDITGQVIHRVIRLVQEVEDSLVGLIRVSRQRILPADPDKGSQTTLEGPQIRPAGRLDVVANQDEVDSLLSSLGF
ncbi:MAG: protein phosphatase CheZ [Gammaproteobacteria bacterium]|nr:protein phosphatase CheZ [Gammaproteobacteria bacterium]